MRRGDPRKIGPYSLLGRIAAGGMGAVYAGHQQGLSGLAAVKTVREELVGNAEFHARFAEEVMLAKRALGLCFPRFYDADIDTEPPWLAVEYVPGPTLFAYVRNRGPLTGDRLVALGVGLAEALARVHAQDAVHLRLKPADIVLGPDAPKLVGFGSARTGGPVGGAEWMSPEAHAGQGATDRSDVFSWATILAFASTGREPFGTGPMDVLARRIMRDEADLRGVPEPLLPLVRAALSKEPQDRPEAAALVSTLVTQWSGRTPAAPIAGVQALLTATWTDMESPLPAPPPKRSRHGLMIGLAAAAGLALAGVTTVAAPSALDASSGAGSDSREGRDGRGVDGGAQGGDETAQDGDDDGGATASPAAAPPEAVDLRADGAIEARATVADTGDSAAFSSGSATSLHVNVSGAERTSTGVRITVNGQSLGVRGQVPRFDQSNFYVLAEGGRIDPAEPFSYSPQLGYPAGEEQNENTLVFPGAAEKGLLVFQSPEIAGARPGPVGMCYSTAKAASFTTDYGECI
ncbi:serine/threonine-protein kinase [Nocardiopsis baichengensis]|uniref:serine/threonine-protein kinase n=1 Tax=Nocardiopsis baichengensis TaxID=280240 RepID=UPI0030843D54